ncbi:MAG: hypothetical protein PHT59_07545, partial [Candidatus Omnitrophica bacterium]|nr:hypothetical protein [Candidatus Omnitrophota bacterium]
MKKGNNLTRLLAAGPGDSDQITAAMSFDEIRRVLCNAFTAAFPNTKGDIWDVYPDHCIISDGNGNLFEVPYTIDENGKVVTGDMAKVRKQVDYIAIPAASHLLSAAGNKDNPDYGYKWHIRILEPGPD